MSEINSENQVELLSYLPQSNDPFIMKLENDSSSVVLKLEITLNILR